MGGSNNRDFCLTVLKARHPKSRCWHGWSLLKMWGRTCSMLFSLLLVVCWKSLEFIGLWQQSSILHMVFSLSLWLCVQISCVFVFFLIRKPSYWIMMQWNDFMLLDHLWVLISKWRHIHRCWELALPHCLEGHESTHNKGGHQWKGWSGRSGNQTWEESLSCSPLP